MTQKEIILDMLKNGWITPLDALREAGCFRLGARIYDLEKDGHAIERDWYSYQSNYGKKKVRMYRLKNEIGQTELF